MLRVAGSYGMRYGLAGLAGGVGCALAQVAFLPGGAVAIGLVAFLIVLVSARWGGVGPGLLATLLIALITLPARRPETFLAVRHALFLACGAVVSLLVGSLRSARGRAENDAARL